MTAALVPQRPAPPPAPVLHRDAPPTHPLVRWAVGAERPPGSAEDAETALASIDWSPLALTEDAALDAARPIVRKMVEAVMGEAGSIDQARMITREMIRWPAGVVAEAVTEVARRHRYELRLADVVTALELAMARHQALRSRAMLAICWHEARRRPKLWDQERFAWAFRVKSGDAAWAVAYGEEGLG